MIYLAIKDGKVVVHADARAMADLDGLEPEMTVTDENWAQAGGSAHIAKGKIVLGMSQAEKDAELALSIRRLRDSDLEAIQWRLQRYQQQRDAEITTTDTAEWYNAALVYVQELRDIPQQVGFPASIEWPELVE